MARIRSIKPDFFTSETVSALPLSTRLTFIGLWTHVDDNGVTVDNPRLINAAVWPLEDDPLETLQRTSGDLQRLSAAGLIVRYEASGRRYLYVRSWDEHQKVSHPAKPRYPRPSDDLMQHPTSGNDALWSSSGESPESLPNPPEILAPEQGAGSREKGAGKREGEPPTAAAREGAPRRGTRLPDDFAVTAEMVAWARENHPAVNGGYETKKFRDYWQSRSGKDATKTDWVATWRNWIRKADENDRGRSVATGANRHTSQRHDNPFAEV
jgi:hypothetical protein